MKIDDSYSFSIPFDWPVKDDDGEWVTLSTTMDVDVEWSDYNEGYEISFECSDEDEIVESGGDLTECYNAAVYDEVVALLNAEGISDDDIASGGIAL